MKKYISILFLVIICSACSTVLNDTVQQSLSSSSAELPSTSSSIAAESPAALSTLDESSETQRKNNSAFFRVDLSSGKEPESIKIISRDSISSFTMSPSCNIMVEERGHINKIYNCVDNTLIENIYDERLNFLRFINGDQIAYFRQMMEFNIDDDKDIIGGILTSEAEMKDTLLLLNLMPNLGEDYVVNISGFDIDFDFDTNLQRYYFTTFLQNKYYEYDMVCAEYDINFNLLSCIITENVELFRSAKDYLVSPSIIALGNRKVYTAQQIEFDFNNLTYQRVRYNVIATETDENKGINYKWAQIPSNRNNQYLTVTYDAAQVISYTDDGLQAIYGTPLIDKENTDGFVVETKQGAIKVVGYDGLLKGASWAPDEGFFFTGKCEEYRWALPPNLEDYLYADSYIYGVFKMLPDNSIHFVTPLPKETIYIGEDTNGFSYFFNRSN